MNYLYTSLLTVKCLSQKKKNPVYGSWVSGFEARTFGSPGHIFIHYAVTIPLTSERIWSHSLDEKMTNLISKCTVNENLINFGMM